MFDKFSFMSKGRRSEPSQNPLSGNIPRHVAIIMDGNGRWAQRRGLPRVAGHREAMKTVRRITEEASRIGIGTLTLYAFSTENWRRPRPEVEFLMKLPQQFLNTYLVELIEQNIQVRVMGEAERLPDYTKKAVFQAVERTRNNTGMILNFALNYGSHSEITDAVKGIVADIKSGKLSEDDINESLLANYLMSHALPDPDLLIRTGGEIRLSNFMLWQLAYTELWFTETYWPDFDKDDLNRAIADFGSRQRRYGGLTGDRSENK